MALSNLIIPNGSSGMEGGGIRFGLTAAGTLTLNNVEVHHNTAHSAVEYGSETIRAWLPPGSISTIIAPPLMAAGCVCLGASDLEWF